MNKKLFSTLLAICLIFSIGGVSGVSILANDSAAVAITYNHSGDINGPDGLKVDVLIKSAEHSLSAYKFFVSFDGDKLDLTGIEGGLNSGMVTIIEDAQGDIPLAISDYIYVDPQGESYVFLLGDPVNPIECITPTKIATLSFKKKPGLSTVIDSLNFSTRTGTFDHGDGDLESYVALYTEVDGILTDITTLYDPSEVNFTDAVEIELDATAHVSYEWLSTTPAIQTYGIPTPSPLPASTNDPIWSGDTVEIGVFLSANSPISAFVLMPSYNKDVFDYVGGNWTQESGILDPSDRVLDISPETDGSTGYIYLLSLVDENYRLTEKTQVATLKFQAKETIEYDESYSFGQETFVNSDGDHGDQIMSDFADFLPENILIAYCAIKAIAEPIPTPTPEVDISYSISKLATPANTFRVDINLANNNASINGISLHIDYADDYFDYSAVTAPATGVTGSASNGTLTLTGNNLSAAAGSGLTVSATFTLKSGILPYQVPTNVTFRKGTTSDSVTTTDTVNFMPDFHINYDAQTTVSPFIADDPLTYELTLSQDATNKRLFKAMIYRTDFNLSDYKLMPDEQLNAMLSLYKMENGKQRTVSVILDSDKNTAPKQRTVPYGFTFSIPQTDFNNSTNYKLVLLGDNLIPLFNEAAKSGTIAK